MVNTSALEEQKLAAAYKMIPSFSFKLPITMF
jgi:hypothetical protein